MFRIKNDLWLKGLSIKAMCLVLAFFASLSSVQAFEVYDQSGDPNFADHYALQFGGLLTDYLLYNTSTARFDISDDLLLGAESSGDVNLWFQNSPLERIMWDNTNDYFFVSDALVIDGNTNVQGTTFTLDSDNTGAGANTDIVSEQGTDNNGTIRYDATNNRWAISNDGGNFHDIHQAAVFYGYDDTGGQTINATEITVNIDNAVVSDSIYSLSADEVTVSEAGLYKITALLVVDGSDAGGAARSTNEVTIQNNTVDIPGSLTKCYHRETEESSCQSSIIVSLSASDVIRFRVVRAGATANMTTLADASSLMIERIR